jgi:hypothetical protein
MNLAFPKIPAICSVEVFHACISRCTEHGLTPLIPKSDTSANTARGLYGKSQFQYDATKDVYVCPANGTLTYRFSTYELGRELKYYRAKGCQACALKSRCTRNQANRTITREANEHLMEAMAARMKQHPEKFKLRKTLAEHPFGTIKRWFGYTHFLLKGLANPCAVKIKRGIDRMSSAFGARCTLNRFRDESLSLKKGSSGVVKRHHSTTRRVFDE